MLKGKSFGGRFWQLWSLTVIIRKVSVKWLKILLAQKIYSFTCQHYHVNDFHESRLSSKSQDYAAFLHLFDEACWNVLLLSFSPFSWRMHISQPDSHASTLDESCDPLQVGDVKSPRKGLEAGLHLASTMIHLSTPAIIAGSIDLHQTLDLEALVGNGVRFYWKLPEHSAFDVRWLHIHVYCKYSLSSIYTLWCILLAFRLPGLKSYEGIQVFYSWHQILVKPSS